jgi:adenosylcobinamide-phosphate synthase
MLTAATMALALGIDALIGWPARLYSRIGHPVTWIGALISALEARWNEGEPALRRVRGLMTVIVVVAAAALPAWVLESLLPAGAVGVILGGFLAWPLIAVRALDEHVAAVARPLVAGDLETARRAVAKIVGRDPMQLDGAGIARAAIESLAENSSDGVLAPLFWGVLLGLPGIAAYKAINTLDSMIGHRNARYEDFGKVAARLDDLANLIPARLMGLSIALVSGRAYDALRVLLRDARAHRSPNAGWPEAAMAGALGVRLSGPRVYGDRPADEPWLNAGAPDPTAADIARGLVLYRRTLLLTGASLAALASM